MAEKKVIEVEVQSNLGSLKSQLREATAAVAEMSEKFGATSEQAIKAAKRAAELKDAIGDAKALTDAFNPDTKFKSLTAAMSGSLNGFTAIQGAMGLMNTDSKAMEETLLKVQSAMALTQGIDGLLEAKDSFKTLFGVIKSGFSSMKAAIASTGIGLLVVAVGLLASNWDKVKSATEGASKKFTDYLNSSSKGAKALKWYLDALVLPITLVIKAFKEVKDLIMGTSDASRKAAAETQKAHEKRMAAFDAERKAQQQALTDMDLKIQLLEAEGKSSVELRKKKLALQKADAESTLQALEATKAMLGKNNIMAKSYDDLIKNSEQTLQKLKVDEIRLSQEVKQQEQEKSNARKEASDKRKAQAQEEKDAQIKAWEDEKAAWENIEVDRNKVIKDSIDEQWQLNQATAAKEKEARDKRIADDKEEAHKKLLTAQALEAAKLDLASQSLSVLNDLVGAFAGKSEAQQKRAFEIQKAVSIAQAVIDTYKGANAIFASAAANPTSILFPAQPFIQAGLAIAAGIANVKKIASTKFGGGAAAAGGGGGSGSSGGGAPQASSNPANFNIVGNSGTNQLAETLSNQPMKAYVVAGEVTSAQSLSRNKIATSTL